MLPEASSSRAKSRHGFTHHRPNTLSSTSISSIGPETSWQACCRLSRHTFSPRPTRRPHSALTLASSKTTPCSDALTWSHATQGGHCASWIPRTFLGAGFYSWFDTYDQTCVGTINCQKVIAELVGNRGGISLQNVITIGSVNMLNANGTLIAAKDNAVDTYPHWAIITTLNAGTLSDVYLPPELVCNTGSTATRTASCQPP